MSITGRVHRFLNLLSDIYKKKEQSYSYAKIVGRRVQKYFESNKTIERVSLLLRQKASFDVANIIFCVYCYIIFSKI
jgi:negative regulator of replication initiation